MSTAADDRKSDVEGTPGSGGPKGAAELTGGYLNYTFIILNTVLAWFGVFITIATLIALQHRYNKSQNVEAETNDWYMLSGQTQVNTFAGFAINSGYPALQPGKLLRFEW